MKQIVRGGLAALAGLIAWAGVGAQSPAASPASGLDATVRAEVVDALAKRLASSYAVAEAGEKMAEAVRSKLAAGGPTSDSSRLKNSRERYMQTSGQSWTTGICV